MRLDIKQLYKRVVKPYVRANSYELIVTLCLFSNLYPYNFPSILYYIGLLMIGWKMLKMNTTLCERNISIVVFIGIIWISSLINFAVNARTVVYTYILIISAPLFTSYRWHLWKRKLFKNICIGFVGTVVVSLWAKIRGVNYQVQVNMGGASMEQYGGTDEFAGYAKFPMWNSAAAALGLVVCAWLLFANRHRGNKRLEYLIIFGMLASFYICVNSASRSAAAFAVVVCLLMFHWLVKSSKRWTRYITMFSIMGVLLFPFYHNAATRMLKKQSDQKAAGHTSRDALWNARMAEFYSSPIFGVGYAVHGTGDSRGIGRTESGSSWLSVLAQTGVIGFIIAVIIWVKTLRVLRRVRFDKFYILVYGVLIFFTLHSVFEGYMFQGGWYMCVICWMALGLINEASLYRSRLIMKLWQEQHGNKPLERPMKSSGAHYADIVLLEQRRKQRQAQDNDNETSEA